MDYDVEECRALAKAARDLVSRELWEELDHAEGYALRLAGEEHPCFAMVIGESEMEAGLVVYRGPRALGQLRQVYEDSGGDDLGEELDHLGFSMTPFRDIRSASRALLRRMGITRNRGGGVPFFMTKRPGAVPRDPSPEEVRLQLQIIKGLLVADDGDLLVSFSVFDDGPLTVLEIDGEALAPSIRVGCFQPGPIREESPSGLAAPPELARGAALLEACWLVGFPSLPMSLEDDGRSLRLVLIVDQASHELLTLKPIMSGDWGGAASELNASIRRFGLPEELVFSSLGLYNLVAPGLEALGARCVFQAEITELEGLLSLVGQSLAGEVPNFSEFLKSAFGGDEDADAGVQYRGSELEDSEGGELPQSLREWKEVDLRVIHRTALGIDGEDLESPATLKRYFGDLKAARALGEGPAAASALPTYWSWLSEYRRAGRRRGSLLERVREDFQGDARALSLIASRLESPPSLYRITEIEAGQSVCVLDLLTGEESLIQDRAMSESVVKDMCLPAKVYAAGPYRFCLPLGPGLTPFEALGALVFLKEQGLDFSPRGFRSQGHLFGRLWAWQLDRRATGELKNADGDGIDFRELRFTLADRAGFLQRLSARDDIEVEEAGSEYSWLKRTDLAVFQGRRVVAAEIEVEGSRVRVQVNSQARAAAVRELFRELGGSRFQANEAIALPPKLRRAGAAGVIDIAVIEPGGLTRSALAWADRALAAIGDRTPREAAKDPKERGFLAVIVRSLPDLGVSDETDRPREALLRELGLG